MFPATISQGCLKKQFQVVVKWPNRPSWPALINSKLQSCPEPSQGEGKDEDEKWGCGWILFVLENWDNGAVFINVLFSVMIHDFTDCRGFKSRGLGTTWISWRGSPGK